MEFFKSTAAIGFMRGRKLAYLISTVLFVVSIGAVVFKGLNLGVDFTGGVTIEAKFTQEAQPEALRRNFEAAGFKEVQVQISVPRATWRFVCRHRRVRPPMRSALVSSPCCAQQMPRS